MMQQSHIYNIAKIQPVLFMKMITNEITSIYLLFYYYYHSIVIFYFRIGNKQSSNQDDKK